MSDMEFKYSILIYIYNPAYKWNNEFRKESMIIIFCETKITTWILYEQFTTRGCCVSWTPWFFYFFFRMFGTQGIVKSLTSHFLSPDFVSYQICINNIQKRYYSRIFSNAISLPAITKNRTIRDLEDSWRKDHTQNP